MGAGLRSPSRAGRARLIVRTARLDDVPVLTEMREAMTLEEQPELVDDGFHARCGAFLERAIAGGRWRIWVAEVDRGVAATMYVQLVDRVPRPGCDESAWGYLTNVYTQSAHRGQGLGSALMHELQAWARRERLELLVVWPALESRAFYRRHGFEGVEPLTWRP